MIKSAIEKVINEDMAEIWSILTGEEKRIIVDNFNVQTFKKNQFIYAEGDEPEYLWCLLKGKVKKLKKVLAVEFRFCASFVRYNISVTELTSHRSHTYRVRWHLSPLPSVLSR